MSIRHGSRQELCAAALSAALFGAIMLPGLHGSPALADKASGTTTLETVDYGEKEGDRVEFWKDEQDREWIIVIVDHQVVQVIGPNGDPGPDDSGREPGDFRTIIAILKQHGGKLAMNPAFADSPLGRLLTREGHGIIPVYNPSDNGFTDDGSGNPGGGFVPGAGSPEQQLKRHAQHGSDKGAKGDDGSDLKPGDLGLFDDSMPGPPPLVNPNPVTAGLTFGKPISASSNGGGANGGGGAAGGAGAKAGGGVAGRH